MSILRLISDSNIYICFLDDIKDHNSLIKILKNATFSFIIGTIVKGEISESYDYSIIEEVIESYIESFSEANYGELLKPLFSKEELKKEKMN